MGIKKPNTVAVPPLFIISMAPRKSFTQTYIISIKKGIENVEGFVGKNKGEWTLKTEK